MKELPWKGGWPVGACLAVQDADSQLCFSSTADVRLCSDGTDWTGGKWYGSWSNEFIDTLAEDRQWAIITREQYEAALAESKKVSWNGEGTPPVGCECQYSLNGGKAWSDCKIECIVGTQGIVMSCDVFEGVQYVSNYTYPNLAFRPIRSEEERRRDESLAGLKESLGHASGLFDVMRIYSAIAAGKIPHVKIV